MKPRRHVILFQSRFADAVESGQKPHTIRPERKRPIFVGDVLDLRAWSGLPYRSNQRKLRVAVCSRIVPIELTVARNIVVDCVMLDAGARDALARSDGFADFGELWSWFDRMHGLPFHGQLIEWAP